MEIGSGIIWEDRYGPTLLGVQISAPISSGSSGGALLSKEGDLIGITTLQIVEGQNLNFAVPADWIRDFRSPQNQ